MIQMKKVFLLLLLICTLTAQAQTYWEKNDDGVYIMKYHSKKMDVDNIYVNDGQFIISI